MVRTLIIIMNTNLYGELCFYENLLEAFKKAAKGKSSKWYVREFRKGTKGNLLQLQKELASMTYQPQLMKTFVICDPKTRVISASAFRDRVVHHALCNIIEPIFDKTFIYDSYANRKGKGTHAALKRFDCFKRKVSGSGKQLNRTKGRNQVCGYVLKADIRRYFDSVDHEILMKIISRKIKDEKILLLIRKITKNHPLGRGMPIGNLTSQFFANIYLNELDRFVKHCLKAKCYIRYVDDFVIPDGSKERLEQHKIKINDFLKTIRLELHPQKSSVSPLYTATKFLGFRVFYHYKLPTKSNMRIIRNRIDYFIGLHSKDFLRKENVLAAVIGWNAYAMHANTYKLRNNLMKEVSEKLL